MSDNTRTVLLALMVLVFFIVLALIDMLSKMGGC